MRKLSKIKSLIKIIIITLSILFAIFICELILRFNDSYVLPEQYSYELSGTNYNFTSQINFNEYSNKKRLLVLGDSFTAGFKYVSEKKDFPEQLKDLLSDYSGNVLNMGGGGKSLPHYIEWVFHLNLSFNDTIVIVLYENDILLDKESCNLIYKYEDFTKIKAPYICKKIVKDLVSPKHDDNFFKKTNNKIRRFHTIKLIKNTLYQFNLFKNIYTRSIAQNLWSNIDIEENIYARDSIIFLKKYIESNNSRVLFTYFPNTHQIKKNKERNKKTWSEFIGYMNKHDVKILNPYNFFYKNASEEKMTHSLTDNHPNEEANYLMAQYLSKFIKK